MNPNPPPVLPPLDPGPLAGGWVEKNQLTVHDRGTDENGAPTSIHSFETHAELAVSAEHQAAFLAGLQRPDDPASWSGLVDALDRSNRARPQPHAVVTALTQHLRDNAGDGAAALGAWTIGAKMAARDAAGQAVAPRLVAEVRAKVPLTSVPKADGTMPSAAEAAALAGDLRGSDPNARNQALALVRGHAEDQAEHFPVLKDHV